MRPLIRELWKSYDRRVWTLTPFPELFHDMPGMRFVKCSANLSLQNENVRRLSEAGFRWERAPSNAQQYHFGYGGSRAILKNAGLGKDVPQDPGCFDPENPMSTIEYMEKTCWLGGDDPWKIPGDLEFSLPIHPEWNVDLGEYWGRKQDRPVCLVHLPNMRTDWPISSRNSDPKYFQAFIDGLKDDWDFISVNRLDLGQQWLVGNVHGFSAAYNNGEIPYPKILSVISQVDAVLTFPSMFLVASLALDVPVFCIYGGYAHPRHFTDRRMDLSKHVEVHPEPFCHCLDPHHECDKEIGEDVFFDAMENFEEIVTAHAS